jgi:multiple sugar transport system permease protein
VGLAVAAAFVVLPVLWMFLSSLKPPEQVFERPPRVLFAPTLHNYEVLAGTKIGEEFEGVSDESFRRVQSRFPKYLLNTVIVASSAALIATLCGGLAGFAFARFRFRGRSVLLTSVLASRFVPPVSLAIPLYVLMRQINLLDSHAGLILAHLSFSLPFVIWTMRSFFLSIPNGLHEAAIVDGCNRLQTFFYVFAPLAIPGLVTAFSFTFILSWNEFLFAILLTGRETRTLAPTISGFLTDKAVLWGRLYAAGTIVVLPLVAATFLLHKRIAAGITTGAVKG